MINIYNLDCMDSLRASPDNHWDIAIVDPPFGIGNWQSKFRKERQPTKKLNWNNETPSKEYFLELQRVSKHQIIFGANYFNCFTPRGGAIVWNKRVPEVSNLSMCEILSCSLQQKVSYVDILWQNINRKEAIIHPCQKPVAIYIWILQKYAKPNWKILDTHLGSGSSAIAADKLGYDFWGYERDRDYFRATKDRIKRYKQQLKLFGVV